MDHERLLLLDGCADLVGKCRLREGDGHAAVGDVAGGVEQLRSASTASSVCRSASASRSSGGGCAPDAAENHFRVLRGAEDNQLGRSRSSPCFERLQGRRRLIADDSGQQAWRWPSTGSRMEGHGEIRIGLFAAGDRATGARWRRRRAGNPRARPWRRRRECRRCRAPAWDRCLRRGSRCRGKRCRR